MRIRTLLITTVVVVASSVRAQAPADTATRLAEVAREVVRIGAKEGESIWPGFRPDTIPLSFVMPSRGDLLFGWRGPLPPGYAPVDGVPGALWRAQRALGAASTASELAGHVVAQVVVGTLDPAILAATAVHEAFHVFEHVSRRPGQRFGQGENAMLVTTYPVFDAANERAFALEGHVLADALAAKDAATRRRLIQEFVAVRRERHRRLDPDYAEFDEMSELNEGLADYALVRALHRIALDGPEHWRPIARRDIASRTRLLEHLTESDNLSLRFRFYQTGPAEALLLDMLGDSTWKTQLVQGNYALQDILALRSGVDDVSARALANARRAAEREGLNERVDRSIEQLKLARRALADSLLAAPGLLLTITADSLPGKDFNSCGYDPQNLLQVSSTVQIQMRWWKPCAAGPTSAEFNLPSVHDTEAGTVRAVIGNASEVQITAGGQSVTIRDGETLRDLRAFRLAAPRATVDAARADVSRHGSMLEIHPRRP